jgi:hypothetical protein
MPANGGAAFPSPGVVVDYGADQKQQGAYEGMSLRDHFAGCALPGLMGGEGLEGVRKAAQQSGLGGFDVTAQTAYAYADAMLRARG